MEELIEAIQKGLLDKGLSEAAASKLALGNPSAIKNLRVRRGGSRNHPIENLLAVARVLDFEFYIGPKRHPGEPAAMGGFAEAIVRRIEPSIDGSAEALAQGFVPVPFLNSDESHRGLAPVAV